MDEIDENVVNSERGIYIKTEQSEQTDKKSIQTERVASSKFINID